MTARLILSFDCEGKWGIADSGLDRQQGLTSEALNLAYTTLLQTLRRYEAPATFAFVSALCLAIDEAEVVIEDNFDRMIYRQKNWLAPALQSVRSKQFEGWSEPELLSLVRHDSVHHICSHGGFHIPYDRLNTPPEAIDADLALVRSIDPIVGEKQSVIVFPRNIVGYRSKLAASGFTAYRNVDRREVRRRILGKVERIFNEFASLDRSDLRRHSYRSIEGMTALSSGKFLNASIGVRARVPVPVTKRRIDTLLEFAVNNGSVVHLYSHPHNLIDDKTLNQKLDYLLARASDYRDKGLLRIQTMKDEFDEQQ